ncbi:ciliary basal body-associated, B9 protein-domain-containing protein [Gorgonomyces haynaldii]|nr:ciliary basal body-associated, B9 protein-domain-containing protein [Gorgonomyces haynaldii]
MAAAEVHLIGTLVGASEFPKSSLCCKWSLVVGQDWTHIEGETSGQTQVDIPLVLLLTTGPTPHHLESSNRRALCNELNGYGFVHIPTTPGLHELEIATWRPIGNLKEQLWTYFLGVTPQLKSLDLIYNPLDRFRLVTCAMGKVQVEISIVLRNFAKSGIEVN